MKITRKSRVGKKVKILMVVAAIAVLLAGGLAYAYTQGTWPFQSDNTTANTDTASKDSEDVNSIDYSPPTSEEQSSSQDAKRRFKEEQERKAQEDSRKTPSGKKIANVSITSAGVFNDKLEIRAYISNVIEDGGTCTATVTSSTAKSEVVTAQSKAFADASSSVCPPIYIPANKLQAGKWSVQVKYTSSNYEGVSSSTEITMP